MLDIHVLVMDYTPKRLRQRCKDSIDAAIALVDYPVAVHYVDGIYGDLGAARKLAYSKGEFPYVTHVDDDDEVEPTALLEIAEYMRAGHKAISTGEFIVQRGVITASHPLSRHHLAVYRRDAMLDVPYHKFKFYPDQFLMKQLRGIHIPKCLYRHHVYRDSGSRRLRRENDEEARIELAMLDRPDLVYVENMTAESMEAIYSLALGDTK